MADEQPTLGDGIARLDSMDAKLDALREDLEIHGRETRREWKALRNELPGAVVAAVAKVVSPSEVAETGARVTSVERRVDALERRVG